MSAVIDSERTAKLVEAIRGGHVQILIHRNNNTGVIFDSSINPDQKFEYFKDVLNVAGIDTSHITPPRTLSLHGQETSLELFNPPRSGRMRDKVISGFAKLGVDMGQETVKRSGPVSAR